MAKSISELDKNLELKDPPKDTKLLWLPVTSPRLTVQGLHWFRGNKGSFCRFPLNSKKDLRPGVWELAQCPASGCIAFRSDTTLLRLRARNKDTTHMPHMPLSGSNGLSVYAGQGDRLRPWGVAIPDMVNPFFERETFNGVERKIRDYRIYLPLYHPLQSLELGFSRGARIIPPTPNRLDKPVVFYGTSVTQGGCANTAGSDFISSVGRLTNLHVINLGFSGNGCGDIAVAKLMARIDAAMHVLDYPCNVSPDDLKKTLPPFFDILRRKWPKVPIMFMSPPCFWQTDFAPSRLTDLEQKRDHMMAFYSARRAAGDLNVHFFDMFDMIHFAADAAYVDGVHPTDEGFQLMARRLAPAIERILLRDSVTGE